MDCFPQGIDRGDFEPCGSRMLLKVSLTVYWPELLLLLKTRNKILSLSLILVTSAFCLLVDQDLAIGVSTMLLPGMFENVP